MPRQNAIVAENNFIKGLITETTAVKFPADACTETYDCVFDETGRVTRRLGFELEENAIATNVVSEAGATYTEFVWIAVGGDGNTNILVQQQANLLRFYDMSTSLEISNNQIFSDVNLDTYKVTGGGRDPAFEQCQYAIHEGNLIVVNPACDPIYIVYDLTGEFITTTVIDIRIRDFAGVDDGLDLTERPVESVASLIAGNPEHYYNLLNQGWYHGSTGTAGPDTGATLAQWDTARTDLPSNADTVGLYRSSTTDAFDNANVLANSPGSRPAPKGHFIISPTNQDRDSAALAEGFTLTLGTSGGLIAPGAFTTISGGSPTSISAMFDGDTSESSGGGSTFTTWTGVTTNAYVGKSYVGTPKQVHSAVIYGTSDAGFIAGSNPNMTFTLYGKTGAAPSNSTDGTSLGTLAFNDTANESGGRTITSSDTATYWDHVWVQLQRTDAASATILGVELQIYSPITTASAIPSTTERPSSVCAFAGRVFYAGINGLGLSSSVFFTRIIRKPDEYAQCYQDNDPTSQDFFDLLPDDGGVIKIPEIGRVTRLFAYQSSLIVMATNGVWRVSGGSGSFAANDYQVRKLSSIGTDAALSVADYKGLPVWWAEDGIVTLQYDANYDSFQVISLTDATIKSFILNVPQLNRQYVKAAFDLQNDTMYWIFNDTASLSSSDYYRYNKVLVMNGLSKAFYPWTISSDTYKINGIFYAVEGDRTQDGIIKYTTENFAANQMLWSETNRTDYRDWSTSNNTSYTSYFITGYRIDGGGYKFYQNRYVHVFMEEEEDASCFVQAIWDWTSDSSTGKWSTAEQCYNSRYEDRAVRVKRMKVRGKGRALQFKYYSEDEKPFTIIGWAVPMSTNADV